MSILFYKKPEFVKKEIDLSQSSCQKYVERAACSRAAIPEEVSFDNMIEGRSLPPCTLQDFLDYLIYVSHDAENLQFFLWFRDYTKRFRALPEEVKNLSQPWDEPASFPTISKTSTPSSPNTMKPLPEEPAPLFYFPPTPLTSRYPDDFSDSKSLVLRPLPRLSIDTTSSSPSLSPPPSPLTASSQPFRDEIDRIIDHYLVAGAPRELNLSSRDRWRVLRALSYTTHPTALATVGQICEQALRHHSHRNFVRWSICNGNKPRVFVLRSIAAVVLFAVIALCAFLVLSSYNRWYRLAVTPALFFGSVNMIASRQGLCVLLHRRHTRERRPWEIDEKAALSGSGGAAVGSEPTPWETSTDGGEDGMAHSKSWREKLAFLGPSNDFQNEPWVKRWERRTPWQKIRIQKVRITENGGLRVIQDRIIWQAEAWSLLVIIVIMAAVCAFPEFGLY